MNFYKKRAQQEEEEEELAESKLIKVLNAEFDEQKQVVFKLLFLSTQFTVEKYTETIQGFVSYPELEDLLEKGLI